jgi:DNA-binding HxlR family transcriptional regulator
MPAPPTHDLSYGQMVERALAKHPDRYFRPTELAEIIPELSTHQVATSLTRLALLGKVRRVRLTPTRSVYAIAPKGQTK